MLENLVNVIYKREYKVEEDKTARIVKSGGLDVLATPEIIRLVENITFEELEKHLEKEYTTVGGYIDINHLRPTGVNKKFEISVTINSISDKKIEFAFEAHDETQLIATGKHIRYIVDKEKFLKRVN